MKRYSIIFIFLAIAMIQLACAIPTANAPTQAPDFIVTPLELSTATEAPTQIPTQVAPAVITATPNSAQPAATNTSAPAVSNSTSSKTNTPSAQNCTYLATYVADVTIPDDTAVAAGAAFTKTWRVRNDGTCTWGPNTNLRALIFTGGSKLGAPDQVTLGGTVKTGQMVDVSVNMTAPATAGTYTSEWKFRLENGTSIGVGAAKTQPLFARIIVGQTPKAPTATPASTSRISFASGATTTSVDGQVNANVTKSYKVWAGKGQLLMASLSSSASDLKLRIVQASTGTVLASVSGTSTSATLPADGDYLVQVTGGGSNASFTLGVTIPARIRFASGATSASVDGKISNHNQVTYLLRALKDQTMTVTVTSSNKVALTIYGLDDGQPLVRAASEATTWTGKLPGTQDYVIIVVPAVDSTSFTLKTTVK